MRRHGTPSTLVASGLLVALLSASSFAAPTTPAGGGVGAGKPTAPSASSAAPAPSAPTDPAAAAAAALGPGVVVEEQGSKRKVFPPPPDPTPGEVAGLQAVAEEARAFEASARAYRAAATDLVKLHYAVKRKELISRLDESVDFEKEELSQARARAIARLEAFVAKYTGPRSQPEATPDAMFRLAALYEERARSEDASQPVEEGLLPAIALYKRIIGEYPKYSQLAGAFYFLGHAYNDAGRLPEAQQVWRSLVCHARYPYPTAADPADPSRDRVAALPQDNTEAYWSVWRSQHQDPASLKRGGPDTTYVDPFPASCSALPQPGLLPGEEPKYVAEVWWQIGNYEFDLLDVAAGVTRDEAGSVYGFNRAASAYKRALEYDKPPIRGVSLYKYAWTLFKQQRYEAATRAFVELLHYSDREEARTGDNGADFRSEAYTYIAGSLTNVDFKGPAESEPFILRPDILDLEPRVEVAEQKLKIGIQRVQDPALVPQDKPWTVEIYKELAAEYRSISQQNNAVAVYELVLSKWPLSPSAPEVQAAVADTFDELARMQKPGTPEYDALATKALEARTKLSSYVGDSAWVQANKNNPAALKTAERLVRTGLRQAAVAHTNNGRTLLAAAQDSGSAAQQIQLLARAREEYRLAAVGWGGFLQQDENAPDAYESRYWRADALHSAVRIQVALSTLRPAEYPEPARADLAVAKAAAVDVRDSTEDDKYIDNAAFFVVDIADVDRDLAYAKYERSGGREGVAERTEVSFDGEGQDRKVQKHVVPEVVLASVSARDDYADFVPPSRDLQKNALKYKFYAGEVFFAYGQFGEARPRFEALYKSECGKSELGYQAWEKLITMSNLERDVDRSRALAEAEKNNSCAVNEADKSRAALIVNPTLQEAAYLQARAKFQEAQSAPPGDKKNALWREAAGLYEAALEAAPGRDEAPEAAMNAAYAYKQVGEYGKAIALYDTFISEYGSEARLTTLEKGDAKTKAPADPRRYQERLKFLGDAYDALGATYYSFFDYSKAAQTYERVGKNERFSADKRKDAAKNAIVLYASMGEKDKMLGQYRVYTALAPSAEEKANADFLVASYDYRAWSPKGADTGSNRQHRVAAEAALSDYYQKNSGNRAAGRYALEAAYAVGRMRRASGGQYTPWFKNTVAAWKAWVAVAPVDANGRSAALAAPYVDYAAEADFTLVDDQIRASYDQESRHKYVGSVADVLGTYDANSQKLTKPGKYQTNAAEADKLDAELDRIVKTYPSLEWVPVALARRGAVWDGLRTGLYNAVPPAIKYFTAQQEKLLQQLEDSGREDLEERAATLRDTAREGWRTKKESELRGADSLMVRNYASAVAIAKKYNVRGDWVQHATGRLAYFTDILGDAKMREYVTQTTDPVEPAKKLDYKDGLYLQSRPGLTAVPAPAARTVPLPPAP